MLEEPLAQAESSMLSQGENPIIQPDPVGDPVDLSILAEHLENLLKAVLGAKQEDLKNSMHQYPDTEELLKRFINDPQIQALYVVKIREEIRKEVEDGTSKTLFINYS